MSKTAGLVALLAIASAGSALGQNIPQQLSNGLSGAAGAPGAAGAAANPYGNDRWGDDRWRDDHWRDDRWRDNPAGGNMPVPNGQAGMPNGNNGAGMPSPAQAQGALKSKSQGALKSQGAANGMLSGNPYDRNFSDADRQYQRPYYPDNFNNPAAAGNLNESDIRKNLSGQGLPPGR